MKIHLVKKPTIEAYILHHPAGRSAFRTWLTVVKLADWDRPEDIRKTFIYADLLGDGSNRVVFNIGGNNYRMICNYYFGTSRVHLFVCWIGTHQDYNELCNINKQYTINEF